MATYLLDQENAPPCGNCGTANILTSNQVGQSFQPSCYDLVRVEVDLPNSNSQGSATAKILRNESPISTAFTSPLAPSGAWSRFDFPSAVSVTPGEQLVLQLESDSSPLPLRNYTGDDTYPYGERFLFGAAKSGDFFFRTYSTTCTTPTPTEDPSSSPTATPRPTFTPKGRCPKQYDDLNACLNQYNANADCQDCLEAVREDFSEGTDTCDSLETKVCAHLNSPDACHCPIVECASALEAYFGCLKEKLTASDLGCDDSLECCFDGCPTPPTPTTPPPAPNPTPPVPNPMPVPVPTPPAPFIILPNKPITGPMPAPAPGPKPTPPAPVSSNPALPPEAVPPTSTTEEGAPCDFFCLIASIIGRIIAAIIAMFGGGGN